MPAEGTRIGREQLLHALESVSPGLGEVLEQSACFVFSNGNVYTFNDEISCRCPVEVGDLTGAVGSKAILDQLRKWKETDVVLSNGDGELVITGKRSRQAGFRMEKDIILPIKSVKRPKEWKSLPDDFCEAVNVVGNCAGNKSSDVQKTFVHVHPKFVEACDGVQLCRWRIKTGVSKSLLVRKEAVKALPTLGVTEFGETEGWLHFRNKEGAILSCRLYVEDYPDYAEDLKVTGTKATLPKGLAEAAEKTKVFLDEQAEAGGGGLVMVELKPGKLVIRGQGVHGWYREPKKVNYSGEAISFLVSPALLIDLVNRHNDVEVSEDRLAVNAGNYRYVACLSRPDEGGQDKEPEETEGEDE